MNWDINPFDLWIVHFVNQWARQSWLFDKTLGTLANNMLFTSGLVTALLCYVWARESPRRERDRSFVLAGLVLTTAALVVARGMALLLPFRERPWVSGAVHFRPPFGEEVFPLIHWSSFPSDHAVMYFALATSLFLVSRKVGIFAYLHALVLVCLPLLYYGFHYPTDLIAGALVGIGTASLAANERVRGAISNTGFRWRANSPSTFYPALYICMLLTATQYDSVRSVAFGIWKAIKRHP